MNMGQGHIRRSEWISEFRTYHQKIDEGYDDLRKNYSFLQPQFGRTMPDKDWTLYR